MRAVSVLVLCALACQVVCVPQLVAMAAGAIVGALLQHLKQSREVAQLEQHVHDLRNELEDLRAQRTHLDPKDFVKHEERLFDSLLAEVHNSKLPQLKPKEGVVVGVVGKVSGGKSTLINALCGEKKARTGMGVTTLAMSEVCSITTPGNTQIVLVDYPGDDDNFQYFHMDKIVKLAAPSLLVVVFDDTPSYIKRVAKLALALGKPVMFVRNKVDNADPDETDVQDELHRDREYLSEQLNILRPQLFGVSARNALDRAEEAKKVAQDKEYNPKQFNAFQFDAFVTALHSHADSLAGTKHEL